MSNEKNCKKISRNLSEIFIIFHVEQEEKILEEEENFCEGENFCDEGKFFYRTILYMREEKSPNEF